MSDRRVRLTDSPRDGDAYVRKDGKWEASVTTSGATGGSGTAAGGGGGNQYFELTIGNVTYKVLHDGTTEEDTQTDNPPEITSTPSVTFTEGTAGTYDMSQHFTDDGVSTVTSSLSGTLASGLTYDGDNHILTYDGVAADSVSNGITLTVTDGVGSATSSSFSITIEDIDTPAPTPTAEWPLNGWALYGGYMIASQDDQFTNFADGLPMLEWNSEKDILVIQGLGWRDTGILDLAASRFKTFKTITPNTKLLYYIQASEPAKEIVGGVVGSQEELKQLIEDPARGEQQTWYLRDNNGNLLESQFDPVRAIRSNCYCVQFQNLNSFGRNFAEQLFFEYYEAFTTPRSNGETLLSLTDGLYWDVVDAAPERVYVFGSDGTISSGFDQNQDNVNEGRFDETIPADSNNEDGYGGARMHRRGAAQWVTVFENTFPSDYVLWRNGSKDGILYAANNIDDPIDQSEFKEIWGGSINENMPNTLGTRDTGTNYVIRFGPTVDQALKSHIRIKESIKPANEHPWGVYGRHGVLFDVSTNTKATVNDIVEEDYLYVNFYAGLAALCGSPIAPAMNPGDPMPRPDTHVIDWGDPIDADYPERMGTCDTSATGNPVTLRAYDYSASGADFWWQEFDNVLWVVRADGTGTSVDDVWPSGAAVECELPDPGTDQKWIYPDLSNRSNTFADGRTITTRNQMPSLYNGSDVNQGGSYGTVSLRPLEAVMLERVSGSAPGTGGGSDIILLDSWSFVDDDDPSGRTFSVSSGTDRVLVLAYSGPAHDISAFGWSDPTVTYGGQSPTATYKFGDATDDSARFFAIWDDAAIAAATSSTFGWSGSIITNEFYGAATYENVQQTGLDSLVNDGSNFGTDQSSIDLTTTSSAGDRIIVIGGTNSDSRTVTSWDTLTERHDVGAATGNARYCLGEGDGGDNTTTVTLNAAAGANFASIVLPKA